MAIYAGYALVINPYSKHKEEAMRYLRYFLENLPEAQAANVLSGAKPVSYFECMEEYKGYQMNLEQAEHHAQSLSGAELEQTLERIDYYHKRIAAYAPYIYAVTEAQIAEHAASVAATQAVWLETDVYVDGSAAAWEQFLAGKSAAVSCWSASWRSAAWRIRKQMHNKTDQSPSGQDGHRMFPWFIRPALTRATETAAARNHAGCKRGPAIASTACLQMHARRYSALFIQMRFLRCLPER